MEHRKPNRSPESVQRRQTYTAAWNKAQTETILVRVRKGKRDVYKALAAERGQSLSGMIIEYLEEQVEQGH